MGKCPDKYLIYFFIHIKNTESLELQLGKDSDCLCSAESAYTGGKVAKNCALHFNVGSVHGKNALVYFLFDLFLWLYFICVHLH